MPAENRLQQSHQSAHTMPAAPLTVGFDALDFKGGFKGNLQSQYADIPRVSI